MKYTVEVNKRGTYWYKEGTEILHRLDGPAYEGVDGKKVWWLDGKLHRLDGPAYEGVGGFKEWYVDGKRHRLDGPAIEWASGSKAWYVDGKLHRLDGPAMEWVDGSKEWYVDGEQLTEEEFLKLTQPAKKMAIAEIQDALGFQVEIVE